MAEKETEITPINNQIVMPAVTIDEAMQAWKAYAELKSKIVTNDDILKLGNKFFLKKSYWRKVATFFNLSVEIISEKSERIPVHGDIEILIWHFTCKATAPNGRFSIGTGSCDNYEKAVLREGKYYSWDKFDKKWVIAEPNTVHNVRSGAETRAFNRAVSNLVGGGELSAEEVMSPNERELPRPSNRASYDATPSSANSPSKPIPQPSSKEMPEQADNAPRGSAEKPAYEFMIGKPGYLSSKQADAITQIIIEMPEGETKRNCLALQRYRFTSAQANEFIKKYGDPSRIRSKPIEN